ncbi:MAG: hypothetical protein KDB88_11270 [Flavobacteriales bacterium]|nr:hypothetical protein [Flavobacteriales bacterium]
MRDLINVVLLCSFSAIVLSGCKKEEEEEPASTSAPSPQMLQLSVNFRLDNVPYQLNNVIEDHVGRSAKFDRVRFLLSNLRLLRSDGSIIQEFPGLVLKVDAGGQNTHQLGLVDQGTIDRIAFDIGLDDATNAMSPADFSGPPLNDQSLYQGTAQGYKFFELTGLWDSNNDLVVSSTDGPLTLISISSSMRRQKEVFVSHSHFLGQTTINLWVQMQDILNGVTLANTSSSVGSAPVNAQIMNNLQAAIYH